MAPQCTTSGRVSVCMYLCMYVFMYVCMYVCVCMYVYKSMYLCMRVGPRGGWGAQRPHGTKCVRVRGGGGVCIYV